MDKCHFCNIDNTNNINNNRVILSHLEWVCRDVVGKRPACRALRGRSLGGSVPPQFMQPFLADAEVVGDFVDHGDHDFLHHFLAREARVQDRLAEDDNPIR